MIITRYNPNGEYTSQVETVASSLKWEPEGTYYVGKVEFGQQYHDFATNTPRFMPPRPSIFHNFDYVEKDWVFDLEQGWASVKRERSVLLAETDWVVTKAAESGEVVSVAWANYRQALRDVTTQASPLAIIWPVKPI
jgi:hypothetical protein